MGLTERWESKLVRQHKCEDCGKVYQCSHCQKAMEKKRKYNLNDVALYAVSHKPKDETKQSRIPWLCEICV